MSLQFILGPASKDHAQVISAQMQTRLADDSAAQIFYLVPNHIKFESEVNLLKQLSPDSISVQSRLQVLSFSRLAWFYLKDRPVYQKPRLNSGNNTLLVAKLLQDHREELNLYQSEVDHPGFIAQLSAQLNELTLGRITADDLTQLNGTNDARNPNPKKFADLALLLQDYQAQLSQLVTPANLMSALVEELTTRDLSHTYFYLNHFNSLNASELHLVDCLIKNSAQVTIALTHNQQADSKLFRQSQQLFTQLKAIEPNAIITTNVPDRPISAAMQAIEAYWLSATDQLGAASHQPVPGVNTAMASDAYAELRQVAREIVQKVHQGARYRDFLIMARHLDPYLTSIPAIFSEFDLPYFVDTQHPMQNHPLAVLIDTLFEVQRTNYSYQTMMRLLRTELLMPAQMTVAEFRDALDVTDNHLLRTGMTGRYWRQTEAWQYFQRIPDATTELDATKTAQINRIKDFVQTTVTPVLTQLKNAPTTQAAAGVLYQWLVSAGVKQQLEAKRQQATDGGDLAAAQAIAQVWQTVCDLLDDFVTTFGDSAYSSRQFQQLLNAGFAGATFTQIPSTLDQVIISETGLTRLNQAQHVYVIGATSTVMPDIQTDTAVLTDRDREFISDQLGRDATSDRFLPESGPKTALNDAFINYLGFMAGNGSLTISYPVHGEGDQQPSIYWTQINAFLHLQPQIWQAPSLQLSVPEALGSARSLLSDSIQMLRLSTDNQQALPAAWGSVLASLRQTSWRDLTQRLLASVNYQNAVGSLDAAIADRLYGDTIRVSVSQLETYFKNPFEYFLQYGLKLRKRPEFELSPADTGTLFHGVLDQFVSTQPDLLTVTPTQIETGVQQLIADFSQQPGFEILQSSERFRFITHQLQRVLVQTLQAIVQQQRQSDFHPRATELMFGQIGGQKGLQPLIYPLARGKQVQMRGKIDRLDTFSDGKKTYFLVLDYKSSPHKFEDSDAYYGTALQMLTYMDAILKAQPADQPMVPAGALYFWLHNPRLAYQRQADAEAIQADLFSQFRMRGILIDDSSDDNPILYHLDKTATPITSTKSAMVELNYRKDGQVAKSGVNLLDADQLDLLLQNNRQRIIQAATDITNGVIAMTPFQYDQEADTITRSDYIAIMQFDPALNGNAYRQVPKLKREDVFDKLTEEEKDDNPMD